MSHDLIDFGQKCSKCPATREQVEDGISCGPIRCKECTLTRICYGGACEECRQNIASTSGQALKDSMREAYRKALLIEPYYGGGDPDSDCLMPTKIKGY